MIALLLMQKILAMFLMMLVGFVLVLLANYIVGRVDKSNALF